MLTMSSRVGAHQSAIQPDGRKLSFACCEVTLTGGSDSRPMRVNQFTAEPCLQENKCDCEPTEPEIDRTGKGRYPAPDSQSNECYQHGPAEAKMQMHHCMGPGFKRIAPHVAISSGDSQSSPADRDRDRPLAHAFQRSYRKQSACRVARNRRNRQRYWKMNNRGVQWWHGFQLSVCGIGHAAGTDNERCKSWQTHPQLRATGQASVRVASRRLQRKGWHIALQSRRAAS